MTFDKTICELDVISTSYHYKVVFSFLQLSPRNGSVPELTGICMHFNVATLIQL
jgi:hypothetical protein